MYEALKKMLDQMLTTVGDADFATNPEVVFRFELQRELATIALTESAISEQFPWLEQFLSSEVIDAVTEHVTVSIGTGADLDEVKVLAQRFTQVVARLLANPSFQALPPVIQRSAIRGFSFTYND